MAEQKSKDSSQKADQKREASDWSKNWHSRHIFKKVAFTLVLIFLIIWIVVGIFILLVIAQGIRQGAYSGLLKFKKPPQQTEPPAQTEASLPGIGKVNIACVREAISQDSLQKVLEQKTADVLQSEEKTKFEACIIEKETPGQTPAESPSQ